MRGKYKLKKKIVVTSAVVLILALTIIGCGNKIKKKQQNSTSAKSKAANSVVYKNHKDTQTKDPNAPKVYMTTHITPDGLISVYKALKRPAEGKVAIKLTVGEPGDTYYLSPSLIKKFTLLVKGTFVDSNTAYGGKRTETAMHKEVAKEHGFTKYTSFDVLDADGGSVSLPVKNGEHLKEDKVGSHYKNYDFIIVLSHFKGHPMAGFGGAIKNMSIGFAIPSQKNLIHTAGKSTDYIESADHDGFLEAMAEAAKAVADDKGKNILYIDIMNNLSVDCDCVSTPAVPTMKNIGILASFDPVALDKACVDQVYRAPDGKDLIERMESLNGIHVLDYAQKIGLGSEEYNLVKLK